MKTTDFNIDNAKKRFASESFPAFYYFKLFSAQLSVCLFVLSNQYVVKLQQIYVVYRAEVKLLSTQLSDHVLVPFVTE